MLNKPKSCNKPESCTDWTLNKVPMSGNLCSLKLNNSNTVKPVYKDHSRVKPVYKDHSREPENVAFMSSCPLYTG
jgi:hypothetical protein